MTICGCVLYTFGLNSTWQTVVYSMLYMLITSYTLLCYHLIFVVKLPFVGQGFHAQYMVRIPKFAKNSIALYVYFLKINID